MDPTQRYFIPALLLLLLLFGVAPDAAAQAPGTCAYGQSQGSLSINNVQASVFNTGSLFYGGSTTAGNGYLVPKAAQKSPIFASGIWVGGKVNGALRLAGARYGNYNFWPGPLGSNGRPVNPANCTPYDRIYSVGKADILAYEGGAPAAADLAEWPAALGAPVVDGDGNPDNYDLAAGDRPGIVGDQGLWWVMNDVGNVHPATGSTDPLGIEVRVLAFSFSRADALGNTTFYKYQIINKSANAIEETYVTVFSDPDLGDAGDDYVNYDRDLSMGIVYNADEDDGTAGGYGIPPAAGYDFFQGPIVNGDTLAASGFSYFINGNDPNTSDPSDAVRMYNYQQGLWGDGTPMRELGTGYGQPNSAPITRFAFNGNPVAGTGWTEDTPGRGLPANAAGDRRLLITTGPFTLNPGDEQDIVFGVVFAQGTSRLNSITALRAADKLAQTAYDINFSLAPPPPAPPRCTEANSGTGSCAEAIALNGKVNIVWGYPQSSENYQGRFEVQDALLDGQPVSDDTYNFEGFNIYRYPTRDFQTDQAQLVATFDKTNGVTTVIDQVFDPALGDVRPTVVARGNDGGIRYNYLVEGLDNYTDYFYGITAYAYNGESTPKVIESSPTQITARPAGLTAGRAVQSATGDTLRVTAVVQAGAGRVEARVIDPTNITGDAYEVRLFRPLMANGTADPDVLTYSIFNTTQGTIPLNGQAYYTSTGRALATGADVAVVDGFVYSVLGPDPGFTAFITTANASGPLVPPEEANPGYQPGWPHGVYTDGADRPTSRQQVAAGLWFIEQGQDPSDGTFAPWLQYVVRNDNIDRVGANDFEMRFVATPTIAYDWVGGAVIPVTFELWNTGVGTPNDASDDYRMVPIVLDDFPQAAFPLGGFNLGDEDHAASGGTNDPYTDRLYWYNPADKSPGQSGFLAAMADDALIAGEVFARTALVNWNGGNVPGPYNQDLPEAGTIFRIETTKPNQPGDTFAFTTAGFNPTESTPESELAALDNIQIVPNPYLGASTYELGNASRVARFTNLPEQAATVRIYTVAGSLIKTLRKDGTGRALDWDLTTQSNLPVASGMYLIHIDIEGVGERILKFGVVQRRTVIDIF